MSLLLLNIAQHGRTQLTTTSNAIDIWIFTHAKVLRKKIESVPGKKRQANTFKLHIYFDYEFGIQRARVTQSKGSPSSATAAALTSNHHVRNEWYNTTMKSVFVLFGNDDNVSLWIEFKRPYPLHPPPPPPRIVVCLSVSVPLKIIRECVSIEMQRMRLKIHQMQTICTPRWTNLACILARGTYCLCQDRDRRIRSRACWFKWVWRIIFLLHCSRTWLDGSPFQFSHYLSLSPTHLSWYIVINSANQCFN